MNTRITELFNIEYPIILGGLRWLGRAELAAAVSEAGGLGLIAAGTFNNKEEMIGEIIKTRRLTSKPFGVNITLGTRQDMDQFFEGAVAAGVQVVFTSGRSPENYVKQLKEAGILFVHVVTSIRHAKKAEDLGANAVVLVGFEGGGHPGMDDVTLMALIPKASRLLKIPVIAAGAITEGKGFAAALAMGAEGVQIGTRFVVTKECIAHPFVKSALLKAQENETTLTLRSIQRAFRVLKTNTANKVLELEKKVPPIEELLYYAGGDAYIRVIGKGLIDAGLLTAGQGLGSIDRELSVKDVIESMVSEAKARTKLLSRMMV